MELTDQQLEMRREMMIYGLYERIREVYPVTPFDNRNKVDFSDIKDVLVQKKETANKATEYLDVIENIKQDQILMFDGFKRCFGYLLEISRRAPKKSSLTWSTRQHSLSAQRILLDNLIIWANECLNIISVIEGGCDFND